MKILDTKATGDQIRKKVDDSGLTPEDLSRMLGLDLSTLYYWFQGKSFPRWDVTVRLIDILGCKLDDLFVIVEGDEDD